MADVMARIADPDKSQKAKADWNEADATVAKLETGGLVKWGSKKKVAARIRVGYRLETRYGFLTASEFLKLTGYDAKQLNVKSIDLDNEEGTRKISGVLYKTDPEDTAHYRTVVFFREKVWFLDEELLVPEESKHFSSLVVHSGSAFDCLTHIVTFCFRPTRWCPVSRSSSTGTFARLLSDVFLSCREWSCAGGTSVKQNI